VIVQLKSHGAPTVADSQVELAWLVVASLPLTGEVAPVGVVLGQAAVPGGTVVEVQDLVGDVVGADHTVLLPARLVRRQLV